MGTPFFQGTTWEKLQYGHVTEHNYHWTRCNFVFMGNGREGGFSLDKWRAQRKITWGMG